MKKIIKTSYFPLLIFVLLAFSCGDSGDDGTVAVTNVSLDKTSITLQIGQTDNLIAAVNPSNATNKSIDWESSNETVATVDNSGKITPVSAGTAQVTATTEDGGFTANCLVTVTNPSVDGVSLNKYSLTLIKGTKETLIATVSPNNAANKNITWTSSNTNVATVSSTGEVTAKSIEGTTNITVTTVDGSYTATCSVTVKAIHVTGVTLNKTSTTIIKGSTETLTATISPSDAENKSVTWTSSNTNVATVSTSGVVTAKAEGSAVITVKTADGNYTATCSVTVNAIHVTGVTLNYTYVQHELTVAGVYIDEVLEATIAPANATDKSVTWTSSDPSRVRVYPNGNKCNLRVFDLGDVTITVTSNDDNTKIAQCQVYIY